MLAGSLVTALQNELRPEWHLLKAGIEGALNPLPGLQGPLAVGTPRPSVDLADRTAPFIAIPTRLLRGRGMQHKHPVEQVSRNT